MRAFASACLATLAAVAALVIFALPATAAPAAPAAVQVERDAHGVVYRVETPAGTLTYGWRPLGTASPDVIRPLSASGCNQEVCISISGSSNHVGEWNTTATWGGGFICTHSFWWINNQLIRTGNGACGGAGVFFSDWAANRFFPSPSLACNTWQSIPGEPCETIHT